MRAFSISKHWLRPFAPLAVLMGLVSGCDDRASSATAGPVPAPGAELVEPRTSARVFFSGHSLLDNPLPDYFELIAESRGRDVEWNQQNVVGSSLRVRTNGDHTKTYTDARWKGYRDGKNREGTGMDVLSELRAPKTLGAGEKYDVMIITERHDLPYVLLYEDTIGYLRHFHDRLIEANPAAQTYFYHGWKGIKDKANPAQWMAYEKDAAGAWECTVNKVNLTLQAEGRKDFIRQMPAALGMVHLIEQIDAGTVRGIPAADPKRLDALFVDEVHYTPLGAYYVAAMQFATVFGVTPEGAKGPEGAHPETVEDLQKIAWDFVRRYEAPVADAARMAWCQTHMVEKVCPTYWNEIRRQPQDTAPCQARFGEAGLSFFSKERMRSMMGRSASWGSPFLWPDPGFEPHPAPPASGQ